MKKIYRVISVVLVAFFAMTAMPEAKATTCGEAIAAYCKAYEAVGKSFEKIKSMKDVESFDAEKVMMESGLKDVDDPKGPCPLSPDYKERLNDAFLKMVTSMAFKFCELAGTPNNQDILYLFDDLATKHEKIVEKSRTIDDYMKNLDELQWF